MVRSNVEGRNATSNSYLRAPTPSYITSPQDPIAPSPISSDVTQFEDVDAPAQDEDDDTEKGSLAGDPGYPNAGQRSTVATPLNVEPQTANHLKVILHTSFAVMWLD